MSVITEFRVIELPSVRVRQFSGLRLLGLGLLACGIGMVPWLVVLAVTLPSGTHAPHWAMAWVGLDAAEAIGLAATGWLTLRRDPRRCLTAIATAALLLADAWFDVATSGSGGALAEALVMAMCAEIPVAALLVMLAYRGLRGYLEPHASAGVLADETPSMGDLVD